VRRSRAGGSVWPSPDFTVVADHRHFGRAAEALHVTQPSLSRQVRRLEQQLGARLLDRTPQGSQLTEAGEVFLPLAKALLRSAAQAAARTRAAAEPSRITIGYATNLIITTADTSASTGAFSTVTAAGSARTLVGEPVRKTRPEVPATSRIPVSGPRANSCTVVR
jgi:hypothetical protein